MAKEIDNFYIVLCSALILIAVHSVLMSAMSCNIFFE